MKENKRLNLLKMLNYIKSRIVDINETLVYYEHLEDKNLYLSTDQQMSYNIALARYNELEKLIRFIESGE